MNIQPRRLIKAWHANQLIDDRYQLIKKKNPVIANCMKLRIEVMPNAGECGAGVG